MRPSVPSIPDGLAKLANGRDIIGTAEISRAIKSRQKQYLNIFI